MKKISRNVTVVLGGQAGSEGKGKFAGYLAIKDKPLASFCNFMPNAGHTWVGNNGEKVMVQQLPQAVVNKDIVLMFSAGGAIELDLLMKEIKANNVAQDELAIHPRAMVIEPRHREEEAKALNRISSTLKGCGYASADKVVRGSEVKLAKDVPELAPYVVTMDKWYKLVSVLTTSKGDLGVLVEAPQGFDLDINHGLEYPYCTSRQTTTAQAIADAGIPPQAVKEVIAVIRPYPIRVGNVYDENGKMVGYSGGYEDSKELSWEEIAERSGTPREEIKELTTVTKKLRRVFELNLPRLSKMCMVNGVTQIALNFANYIDYEVLGATKMEQLTPKVLEFIAKIEDYTGVPVTLIGTGARDCDIVDLRKEKLN